MIRKPATACNVNEIVIMYYTEKKKVHTLRLGQFFLNVAFPSVNDPKLFHCVDDNECMEKILYRYAYEDGQLSPVNDALIER